ncbi:MAG: LysM peptidoglycan-binding domain-containing protein [Planctomycetaceae bacterium]
MNGFSPLFPSRKRHHQLLAFAVASWLGFAGLSELQAQDTEAPAAPPSIPSEEVPLTPPTESATSRPVKPYSRKSNARPVASKNQQRVATKLIPTGPEDQPEAAPPKPTARFSKNTELIPTDVQPKTRLARKSAAEATIEVPLAEEPGIQQVEAEAAESAPLAPRDELKVPSLEPATDEVASESPEVQAEEPAAEPAVPGFPVEDTPPVTVEETPVEVPALDSAPSVEFGNAAPARKMPAAQFEPTEPVQEVEELETEPAPLDERATNSQPVPTDFNIRRTAAADNQPYNDTGVHGFSPNDTVHIVGKGESFWTIAKKHYRMGRYSAALAEYNKSRIPKPDRIAPGMKVIVPPVATLEQKFGHMISGYVSPESEAAAAAAKPGFFVDREGVPFYRVGEGDTLSDIARNHLGRSSRWIQIVGLNKERLPNPDAMKPGMVLRLPDDASEMVKAE